MRGALIAALTALAMGAVMAPAGAWGLRGHAIIGQAAMAHVPAALPAFVRSDAAKSEIVYLQSEEDRLKIGNADEKAWTREWNTDHYIDLDDRGRVGGVSLDDLPVTRDDYEQLLERAEPPLDAYNLGFLPYAIVEGYEQVRSDFALWRLAVSQRDAAQSTAARNAASSDVAERERLTIHDIGIFSHFVGDGSQPLHVSVHYNGWGRYPNPEGFTQAKTTHAAYEDAFVNAFMNAGDVDPLVGEAKTLSAIPLGDVERYLLETDAQVVPFYRLEKSGAFVVGDSTSAQHRQGVQFTARRLAAAATMLDSLILTAWQTSATLKETN